MTFNDHAHLMGLIFPESLNQAFDPLNNMNVAYNLWLICTKKICIRHTHEQASIKVETLFLCSDDVYYRAYCLGCNRWVRVSDDWLAISIMMGIMSYITLTAGNLNISHNIATCMKAPTTLIIYYVPGPLHSCINLNCGRFFYSSK